jgi:hypothetical protein
VLAWCRGHVPPLSACHFPPSGPTLGLPKAILGALASSAPSRQVTSHVQPATRFPRFPTYGNEIYSLGNQLNT